jgi:hypothetical protein
MKIFRKIKGIPEPEETTKENLKEKKKEIFPLPDKSGQAEDTGTENEPVTDGPRQADADSEKENTPAVRQRIIVRNGTYMPENWYGQKAESSSEAAAEAEDAPEENV